MSIINYDYFTSGDKTIPDASLQMPIETVKKKRTKKTTTTLETAPITTINNPVESNVPMCQSNRPYIDTYAEATGMLRQAIGEIDSLGMEVVTQINAIKNNKTLKGKYNYLDSMINTASSLITAKVNAVGKISDITTKSHELEMRRAKEIMKIDSADKADDDKVAMEMYKAFISAPPAFSNTQYAPPLNMLSTNNQGAMPSYIIPASNDQQANADFNNFLNTMSPETNMMILENNPNIKTVVRYNPATGNRMFDVVDVTTGQSIPNTPKPANLILEDTVLDLDNKMAKNSNLNTFYPIIITDNL